MKCRFVCGILSSVILTGGCAPGPLDESAWAHPRPLGHDLPAVRPSRSPASASPPPAVREPVGALTLRAALSAALLGSPELASSGYDVRAQEAEALQAGLPPNPQLDVELENFGGAAGQRNFDAVETTLALSQIIELGGKRVNRHRVGAEEARLAGWAYEIRRIDVLSKTAADFVGLLAAERSFEIAEETLGLAQRVFDAVGERVDAGKVSPVERTKARVELARAGLSHEQSRRAVAAARTRLASNWGSTNAGFTGSAGDLDRIVPPPSLASLLERVEQNPDVARWATVAALRRAETELALSGRVPDATVTGGVRHFNETDDTAFVAGLSLPLPVFDQNQGTIRAARMRALGSDRRQDAARVRARTAVVEAFQRLDAAFATVGTLREEILPSSVRAFGAAEEAFRQGKIGALDLLDAERTLFEARRDVTDALSTYHLAVIACERLIGAPLDDASVSGSAP